MPVTLNKAFAGGGFTITAINENFSTIERLLKEGISSTDISGVLTHYNVKIYTGGRISHMFVGTNPFLSDERLLQNGIFESLLRKSGFSPANIPNYAPDYISGVTARFAEPMELLGRPGPSFYFDFLEDGYTPAWIIAQGILGWPPTYWPILRYPKESCYSYWLTVPHAAGRVYVQQPCIARLTGNAQGAMRFSKILANTLDGVTLGLTAQQCDYKDGVTRVGLFADTNPTLFTDEFANTNDNIVNPDGGVAGFCTWKKLEDITIRDQHITTAQIPGLVKLNGKRSYNFSMKFRRANTVGHVYDDGMGAKTFTDCDWEYHNPAAGYSSNVNFNPAAFGGMPRPYFPNGMTPFTLLWSSADLCVEFFYGRGAVETDGWTYSFSATSGPDFHTKPA